MYWPPSDESERKCKYKSFGKINCRWNFLKCESSLWQHHLDDNLMDWKHEIWLMLCVNIKPENLQIDWGGLNPHQKNSQKSKRTKINSKKYAAEHPNPSLIWRLLLNLLVYLNAVNFTNTVASVNQHWCQLSTECTSSFSSLFFLNSALAQSASSFLWSSFGTSRKVRRICL